MLQYHHTIGKTNCRDFSLETEPKLDQFLKTVTITPLVMTIWHYRNSIIIIITYYTAVACIILQLDSTTYWQVVAGGAFWTLIVPIRCQISYCRPRYSAPPWKEYSKELYDNTVYTETQH